MKEKTLVRDKFYFFGSRAHDDDIYFGVPGRNRTHTWSRISPAEGAHMLGVPNMILVSSDGDPVPFSSEAYCYMESFCRMKNVLWSVVGSCGFRSVREEEFICELAEKYPNVTGAYIDDMFVGDDLFGDGKTDSREEEFTQKIIDIRNKLNKSSRPLELWATCYVKDVEKFSAKMYDPIDVIAVWNMNTDDITKLEEDIQTYEKLLPQKRKVLGIYLYDYKKGASVSKELMEIQCEKGLKWLKEGRIEGMVFLTNCVMGIGLESEYWLRDWIDKVGDEEL